MRFLSELIDERRKTVKRDGSVLLPDPGRAAAPAAVNLIALGDVGGMVLTGLRLLGGDAVSRIGIYDLNDAMARRYEMEINQIRFPDGRQLPEVRILDDDGIFDCDMLVFCASAGVPPVGAAAGTDVRMVQLEANGRLVSMYAEKAARQEFGGIFAVVSDPVDPLCKKAVEAGLDPLQVQGYGLGVMNGRAAYFAARDERFGRYLTEGRAFGPHGADLVIADSIEHYDDRLSAELTELTVNANMQVRADGFKPYIAPALSSGAISLLETVRGGWNYSSVYLGCGGDGAFMGCRNRRTSEGIEIEDLPLAEALFARIIKAYDNLRKMP